jgi:hypothetical protein
MEQLSSAAEDQIAADQVAVARELNRLSLWARRGAPAQLSSTSITTLDTLEYAGPTRITDLATGEGMSQPGMTTLINRLEGGRSRAPGPTPRTGSGRYVRLYGTQFGYSLWESGVYRS